MIDLSRPRLDAALLQSVAKSIGLNDWYVVSSRQREKLTAQDQESQDIIEDLSAHLV